MKKLLCIKNFLEKLSLLFIMIFSTPDFMNQIKNYTMGFFIVNTNILIESFSKPEI
jgi:hypothetical protein